MLHVSPDGENSFPQDSLEAQVFITIIFGSEVVF